MDSGARYSATVSQITGGGADRSFGVNIYLQREETAIDDVDPGRLLRTAWEELPSSDLLERLRVHLHRGRHFRQTQLEVLQRILFGESVSAVFGPGRGRRAVIGLAAAAAAIAVPPGVVTWSLSTAGCSPVSRTREAAPSTAWVARRRATLRDRPIFTPPSVRASMTM